MVVITKLGTKLDVKDEATALDMVEKNAGWTLEEDTSNAKPVRKKSAPTD